MLEVSLVEQTVGRTLPFEWFSKFKRRMASGEDGK